MLSFIKGLVQRQAAGSRQMSQAWEQYEGRLRQQGLRVECWSRPPEPGATFWVFLSEDGQLEAQDASFLRRRVAAQHFEGRGVLRPVDTYGRPIPFERQQVDYSGESGEYSGLSMPRSLEHLTKGHPSEAEIRARRAGQEPPKRRQFDGLRVKVCPVFLVKAYGEVLAITIESKPGGTHIGSLTYAQPPARVRQTHVIWGAQDWPAAPIAALLLRELPFGLGGLQEFARLDLHPDWTRFRDLSDRELLLRFDLPGYGP